VVVWCANCGQPFPGPMGVRQLAEGATGEPRGGGGSRGEHTVRLPDNSAVFGIPSLTPGS